MIIKDADGISKDLATLEGLLLHPEATPAIKKRIEDEMRNIKAGARNEADVAFEMSHHFGGSKRWAVIHGLRLVHEGEVAQIDHLAINCLLDVWVCESKSFSEGVAISEHGEFTAFHLGKPRGIASPIEQNARHVKILGRLLDSGAVALPKRLGFTLKPAVRSLVLISNKARIARPRQGAVPGIDSVIKAEQFYNTVVKAVDDSSALSIAKLVAPETLEGLAREIAALHVPAEFDWHAKFGIPKQAIEPVERRSPVVEPKASADAEAPDEDDGSKAGKQKLICASCSEPVEYKVAKFCWFNKAKFGGRIYCMGCQKKA